jgi:predicted metalloendopeptidase
MLRGYHSAAMTAEGLSGSAVSNVRFDVANMLLTFPRWRGSNPQTLHPGVSLTTHSRKFVLCLAVSMLLAGSLAAQSRASNSTSERLVESRSLDLRGCAGAASGGPAGQGNAAKGEIDPADFDRSVSPCEDFFEFATGGWAKRNPIPAAYASWGISEELDRRNKEILRRILEKAAADKSPKPGSPWQKIGDYYGSCMDESAIEAARAKPLEAEFERVAAISDLAAFQAEVAHLHTLGVDAVFNFSSDQDFKDSTREIAEINQGGLGLPDRGYYTRDDDPSKELRAAYLRHMTKMFQLLADDPAKAGAEAKTVLEIETRLANASLTNVELRDPDNIYHQQTLAELSAGTPHFRWAAYFRSAGAQPVASLNVSEPDFFKAMDAALTAVPLDDWKIYLRWHVVHTAARALSKDFQQENFDFYGRALTGAKEQLPRWQRCVDSTDAELGEALGEFYVADQFPPAAKAAGTQMVKNVIAALRDDLSTLDWMAPATRQKALEKLNAIMIKVGYPNQWRDYSAFRVERGPYVGNVSRGTQFEFARQLAKIGKPVDRTEWTMTPPTVNAYYNPLLNEIVFPAGILQPPLYDPKGDDAVNYGATAATIGHEMTHSFDDQGAKFDAQGNLKNWWTDADLKNFNVRGDCVAKQFDEFEVEPGLYEQGKLVEGESIADLGGLAMAYAAYRKSLEGKPAPASVGGFTADQRFFIAYAVSWEDNLRPEFARLITESDPHPLPKFRVNGPLANTPAFHKAFACTEKSLLVPPEAKRCRIW